MKSFLFLLPTFLINDQVIPAGNVALYKLLVLHSGYCNNEGVYYKIEEAIEVCTAAVHCCSTHTGKMCRTNLHEKD